MRVKNSSLRDKRGRDDRICKKLGGSDDLSPSAPPGVRGRLRLNQFAFPRNALIRFVCTFDAVLELEPIVWEVFGHFIDPTRCIATDCRPETSRSRRYGTYVKALGIPEEVTELNSPNGVVRFTPQSGQSVDMLACPLRAISRHMQ